MKKDQAYSVSRLSVISKLDRRTVAKLLAGTPPAGGSDAAPRWSLRQLEAAGKRAVKKPTAGSPELKSEKLVEEIRKLKHANDLKAGAVVSREAVAACFLSGKNRLQSFRFELETKWALDMAGLPDIPSARVVARKIVDEIYAIFADMGSEFDVLDKDAAG